ncbi:MAG: MmgE/PrpD family protein [Gammaproteobacteria bacterium]|nr:MmgE/PrpD family protein [Gammaproteobacteria bacterium]
MVDSKEQVTEKSISEVLADFVIDTADQDIPAEVRTRALHHILDALGIAFASTRYDFAHRTLNAIRNLSGTGVTPVIGMATSLPPRDAAIVNGLLCHGLDFDDTHVTGVIHPTASLFPLVLSAASTVKASGSDVVTAYILGMEAAARLGSVAKGGFHQVGFHPTGVIGIFACTLAAGRLYKLNRKQLVMAQGIALSMASGSLEFLQDGAWNKRIHPGWAAASALTAVSLAREGFVGISKPYEGRFGLFNTYLGTESDSKDLSLATAGLGSQWELMGTAIKPFPACHFTHACIDSALHIRKKLDDLDEIESITALVPQEVVKTVCEPVSNKKKPANSYEAQFSIPYAVAAALCNKRFTLQELDNEMISDPGILTIASKVEYQTDPDSPFPKAYSGELVVTLKSGEKISHREHINRGVADRPLSNGEIADKFKETASLYLSQRALDEVKTTLLDLDKATSAKSLINTLSANT